MIEALARYTGLDVQEVDAAQFAQLARLPLAQKRTSRGKAYVYLTDREVLKGPYAPRSPKLVNNLRYPHLIHLLEESLQLPNECRGVFRWSRLLVSRSGAEPSYVLAGPNVGRPEQLQVESVSTQVDASFQVAVRGTLVRRVSELEKVKQGDRFERHPDLDETVALAALQHLYLRYLLNLGDSGTHNILAREDRATSGRPIAGIDFDEQRGGGERRTLLGHFFKQDYSYLEDVYGDTVGRLVWLQEVDATLEDRLGAVNALCEGWSNSLAPARRAPETAAFVVRGRDLLERSERLRSLRQG